MSERADILVIGLGAMGSAALYQLAKRGVQAVGVDRFAPPHLMGSSHGETRITRQAVGEGRDYVPLVLDTHRIWRELEAETSVQLMNPCGVIVMAPGVGETSHHGKPDFVARSIAAARDFGIAHEVIDGREVAYRFPQFLNLEGNEKAYYEPGGGYVLPENCIKAQLTRAEQLGAVIRTGVEVLSIAQAGSVVRVETPSGSFEADQVVVSAGAWNARLLGAPFDRVLTVKRQVLHWYELDDVSAYRANAPVFIWMHGATDVDYLYGFPPLPGDRRIKVATEQYETSTTADTVDRTVDPAESAKMYQQHVKGRLAGATPRVAQAAACLYTTTPDRGFIIDRHPDQDRVFVVSACSGHGFKHSAGIGNVVAQMMVDGRSSIDLTPFSMSRFS
ncbi:methyltryptophan oxidase [Bradyrhizobium sp. CCBAU 11386]|uniref:N-methyl-L-tryptophan oxidase n=1 Tax=Bradyrhizobium sp. CCBAU 11386 TaxID=1630837 RepID=UPI0023023044|nr:N-methyl-L-tryptophan oxidase [Bradyrhizobium sp. CCBAU 11386]MDA9504045.1 methyltryptophan oxidase [Bradyrhizobium sp. CCBAU 11386]